MISKPWFLATGTLAGAIIGAGMFALPYFFVQFGILWSALLLCLGALAYSLLHLLYADVILRTPGAHAFVGYTRRYLGHTAGAFAVGMAVVEMILVLTVYLILSISFTHLLFPAMPPLLALILFWACGSALLFVSIRGTAFFEVLLTWGMIGIIVAVFLLGFRTFGFSPFSFFPRSIPDYFLPLAPIFFALSGRVAIPTVLRLLGRGASKAALRSSLIVGTLIPAILYGLFVAGVIGLSSEVSPDSVEGLLHALPPFALYLLGILGLFCLITSYLLVALDVRNTLRFDLRFSLPLTLIFIVAFPLLLYLVGFTAFLPLVTFIGGVFLSLEALFIVALFLRARGVSPSRSLFRHPLRRSTLFILAFLFLVTLLYQLFV